MCPIWERHVLLNMKQKTFPSSERFTRVLNVKGRTFQDIILHSWEKNREEVPVDQSATSQTWRSEWRFLVPSAVVMERRRKKKMNVFAVPQPLFFPFFCFAILGARLSLWSIFAIPPSYFPSWLFHRLPFYLHSSAVCRHALLSPSPLRHVTFGCSCHGDHPHFPRNAISQSLIFSPFTLPPILSHPPLSPASPSPK